MAAAEVAFWNMTETELRQWVEANPGRVNEPDRDDFTLLYVAVSHLKSLSLTVWLRERRGRERQKQSWNYPSQ